MKALKALLVLSFVALGSRAALAQDPVKVASAHYSVVMENASVRVLKIDPLRASETANVGRLVRSTTA